MEKPKIKYGTKYVVEKNDNLYEIAEKFNTTVKELKNINNLKSNLINPGDVLIVDQLYKPEELKYYKNYIVKKNDTVYTVAFKHKMTTNELMEINNMISDSLNIGDVIFVYDINDKNSENITYTVKKGDSLYSIAREFHVTVEDIKNLNNLTSDKLQIGDVLTVLTPDMIENIRKKAEVYFVLPGDSLYTIAQKRNTTADTLRAINNLRTDKLSIGQRLLIP